jgi:hypothetical protein
MKFITYHYGVYTNVNAEVPYAIGSNGYYTYLEILYKEFGLPLFTLSLLGFGYAVYKREDWDYILLAFALAMYLILGGTAFLVQDRYLMTVFIALFMLGGRFIDSMIGKLTVFRTKETAVIVLVFALVVWPPLVKSIKYVRTLSDENTSVVSKRWIEENIPANSKILMDAGRTIISSGPRISQSRNNLEEMAGKVRNLKEGETYDSPLVNIVDSYSSIYFELALQNIPPITYDITTTELGRKIEPIDYYKKSGFGYYIYAEDIASRFKEPAWREKYPNSASFYDSIDRAFILIKEFDPSKTRSGPRIRIYRIN